MTTKSVPRQVPGLHLKRIGEELLVHNPAKDTAHAINMVASGVFEACDGTNDVEDIVEVTAARATTPVDRDVVVLALSDLVEAGLVTVEADVPVVSRRALIGRLGAGEAAAAALPVVEPMIFRPAAAAVAGRDAPSPRPTAKPTPARGSTQSDATTSRPFS